MILHRGSQLHPTVLNQLNYSLIDLAHNSPVIRSCSCDNSVPGRAQCPHTNNDELEMVVKECVDFPKARCKHLILHRLRPFIIQSLDKSLGDRLVSED